MSLLQLDSHYMQGSKTHEDARHSENKILQGLQAKVYATKPKVESVEEGP
jgi:hypothetical protein